MGMKIKESVEILDEKFETAFTQMDMITRNMFIEGVMKEDKVTREEAVELIATNPMYSMGLKYAIFRNRNKLDLRTSRKVKKQRFLESLTPEELEQYEKGPKKGYFAIRKMEKEAEKQAKKDAEVVKKKMKNGEEITDEDLPENIRNAMKEIENEQQ